MTNPLDDLFAAQFLQIIGGTAGAVLGFALFSEDSDLMSPVGSCEPAGRRRQNDGCFGHPAHSRLVEIDSTDLGFADLRWLRKLLQYRIGDEALIDAA